MYIVHHGLTRPFKNFEYDAYIGITCIQCYQVCVSHVFPRRSVHIWYNCCTTMRHRTTGSFCYWSMWRGAGSLTLCKQRENSGRGWGRQWKIPSHPICSSQDLRLWMQSLKLCTNKIPYQRMLQDVLVCLLRNPLFFLRAPVRSLLIRRWRECSVNWRPLFHQVTCPWLEVWQVRGQTVRRQIQSTVLH